MATSMKVGEAQAEPLPRRRPRFRFDPLKVLYALAALYVIAFLLFPLGKVLLETVGMLFNAERPLPDSLIPYMLRMTNSIRLALITTVVSGKRKKMVAISVALAVQAGWTVLLTLPFITPPFISSFAVIILFGRTGVLTRSWRYRIPAIPIYGLNGLVMTQSST